MPLGDRLRDARKRNGLTQKQLAQQIGAKHNSVSNWEQGLNMPDPGTIELICKILDTTPNFLLMGNEFGADLISSNEISHAEAAIIKKYRRIDRAARGAVNALLDYYSTMVGTTDILKSPIVTAAVSVNGEQRKHVPQSFEIIQGMISKQSVAAGTGTYLDPDMFENISVRKNALTRRAAFYVPVSGNSMEPRFHDGDILVIERVPVKYGEIGIFTLDGNGFVKVRGKSELISLNPDYDPIPMNDDVICNGKVIGILEADWLVE